MIMNTYSLIHSDCSCFLMHMNYFSNLKFIQDDSKQSINLIAFTPFSLLNQLFYSLVPKWMSQMCANTMDFQAISISNHIP